MVGQIRTSGKKAKKCAEFCQSLLQKESFITKNFTKSLVSLEPYTLSTTIVRKLQHYSFLWELAGFCLLVFHFSLNYRISFFEKQSFVGVL